jgi:hypothetical protein
MTCMQLLLSPAFGIVHFAGHINTLLCTDLCTLDFTQYHRFGPSVWLLLSMHSTHQNQLTKKQVNMSTTHYQVTNERASKRHRSGLLQVSIQPFIRWRSIVNIFNHSVLGTQIFHGLRKVLQKTEVEYFHECMIHTALDYCLALNTFTRIITICALHDDFFSNSTMP